MPFKAATNIQIQPRGFTVTLTWKNFLESRRLHDIRSYGCFPFWQTDLSLRQRIAVLTKGKWNNFYQSNQTNWDLTSFILYLSQFPHITEILLKRRSLPNWVIKMVFQILVWLVSGSMWTTFRGAPKYWKALYDACAPLWQYVFLS